MKRYVIALLAVAMPATLAMAATGDMSVETFLAKADALRAKGLMALMSSDIGLLKAEGLAAGRAYHDRLAAERRAGRPSSCPPKGARVNSTELMTFLRTYPNAVRPRTAMRAAIGDYSIQKWPCPPK